MSVESAEMTKHAINAFLATSIVFANELALICETVGADAKEVERGLKSETRIGPRAYLSPGAAFAGGTLGRDIAFLNQTSCRHGVTTPLLCSVLPSNDLHKRWAQQKLAALCADLSQITVTVWGLTYKPGTDTLRRSMSVELCDWLISQGASIHVYDPLVTHLPERWGAAARRYDDPLAAVRGAQALVLATDSPAYSAISGAQLLQCVSNHLLVLDANRFSPHLAGAEERLEYVAVGTPIEDV
jgi:UDPglucose 6-dehydrogenase